MVAKTNENASKDKKEDVVELGIDKLKYFENHPFKIVDEDLSEWSYNATCRQTIKRW